MVCLANVCRSPMAEALLRRALDDRLGPGHDVAVGSAGIGAHDGQPPSQGAIRAMELRGIDIRHQRSSDLTAGMAARADLIYCMEDYQVGHVRDLLAGGLDRARTMGEDVPDPMGHGQLAYDAIAARIESLIPRVVDEIAAFLGDRVC